MSFRLLVFDWDGTLMDSEARIVASVQAAAADLQLPPPSREAARDIIGLGLAEAVTTLFPGADAVLIERMATAYRRHFLGESSIPTQLFADAAETVRALEAEGYLLAVATGKGRQGLDAVLEHTGMKGLFHCTRCANEAASKPHPEMLLHIMEVLGAEPEETLMIGDTSYDMEMAVNAQTARLAVSYGAHPVERLLPYRPLGALDRIGELGAWLKQNAPLDPSAP